MEITQRIHEHNIMVMDIQGEVDAYTAQHLNRTLLDLLDQGYRRVVLDVSKMIFISSAGIGAILFARREAAQLGAELRIVAPNDQIRRLFELAGFFELFQISDALQESLADW